MEGLAGGAVAKGQPIIITLLSGMESFNILQWFYAPSNALLKAMRARDLFVLQYSRNSICAAGSKCVSLLSLKNVIAK